jgi:transcriptional repressor NrdR
LDDVAYVRFASVYKQFKDPADFEQELKELLESRKRKEKKQPKRPAEKERRP